MKESDKEGVEREIEAFQGSQKQREKIKKRMRRMRDRYHYSNPWHQTVTNHGCQGALCLSLGPDWSQSSEKLA